MQVFIYLMASESGTLYIGVTTNLQRQILEHKLGVIEGFTKKHGCKKLVYFEQGENILSAIEREKQLKRWERYRKEELINSINPAWRDLYEELW